MLKALARAVRETPYSAVVKHTAVDVVPMGISGDKHVFEAQVVAAIRGQKRPSIRYFMMTERGETPGFAKEPTIVALCRDEGGLYWPGTGAQFPLTDASAAVARDVAKQLPQKQEVFHDCE